MTGRTASAGMDVAPGSLRQRVSRAALRVAAALAVLVVALGIGMRVVPLDAADWHTDPLGAPRSGAPNGYLVLPEGMNAPADRMMAPRNVPALELMTRFDAVALAAPRVERVAGSPQLLFATYVQRSAVFGFPDYISVRAVEGEDGAALAIWSRSRFGYSDLGVNRRRVEAWLAALDSGK